MSRRILVTGATGFLGHELAVALRADGHVVRGTGRDRAKGASLRGYGVEFAHADLAGPEALAPSLLADCDAVVHCAGLSAPWGPRAAFGAANVEGTKCLLEAAARQEVEHVVFISSSSVYFRFRDQIGVREDEPLPRPVNAYAWSKVEAERLVMASPSRTTILRPRGIYGRGDTALLPRLLAACDRGPLPLLRGGGAVIDLTHVDDVVSAIRAVLATPPRPGMGRKQETARVYNVSSGEPIAVGAIVEACAARTGRTVAWRAMPWPACLAAVRASEAFHRLRRSRAGPVATAYSAGLFAFSQTLDITAIGADMDWRPTITFEEGLRRTFP